MILESHVQLSGVSVGSKQILRITQLTNEPVRRRFPRRVVLSVEVDQKTVWLRNDVGIHLAVLNIDKNDAEESEVVASGESGMDRVVRVDLHAVIDVAAVCDEVACAVRS